MNKLSLISHLVFILAGLSQGVASDKPPTADSVLQKYVQSIGGKEAWDKFKSRTIKAEIEVFGSKADWHMDAKAPNKVVTRVDLPGLGQVDDGFDGTVGWRKDQSGARAKEGEELSRAKRMAEFNREVRLKEIYPDLAYKSSEKLDGVDAHILESKPGSGTKERFAFDAKTGFLIRNQVEFEQDGQPTIIELNYSDYREVDMVKLPYTHQLKVFSNGQNVFEVGLKVKEFKHNEQIEDAKFAKPSE